VTKSILGTFVTGPAGSTDNAVARFNGTSGYTLQNSGVIIDDSNNVSGIGDLDITGSVYQVDNESHIFGTGNDVSMYYDGTDFYINTSLVVPSDLKIACGTDKTLELQESVWDDVYPSAVSLGTGATAPTVSAIGGSGNLDAPEFAGIGATVEEMTMHFQLPHSYKEGTTIYPHLHLHFPTDIVGGGNVKLYYEYDWINVDAASGVTTGTGSVTITVAGTAAENANKIVSLGSITGTGKTISSIVTIRIYRLASDASDTWVQSVWWRSADIHIEKNTIGSRQVTAK